MAFSRLAAMDRLTVALRYLLWEPLRRAESFYSWLGFWEGNSDRIPSALLIQMFILLASLTWARLTKQTPISHLHTLFLLPPPGSQRTCTTTPWPQPCSATNLAEAADEQSILACLLFANC